MLKSSDILLFINIVTGVFSPCKTRPCNYLIFSVSQVRNLSVFTLKIIARKNDDVSLQTIYRLCKTESVCYYPNSTHVCYRILVHVGFTGFENRHVTGVIPFCFPENSLGIAMFYMSMEKFVFQSWHRSVFDRKNWILFWNCSSTLSQAGYRLVKRNHVLELWFNFVTGRI